MAGRRVSLVKDPRCGTYAGAQAHAKFGEYLCTRCRVAYRDYHREHKKTPSKARQRVLQELRRRYHPEYLKLLDDHRWQLMFELELTGEDVPAKTRTNRVRQRALGELARLHAPEYQRLMTDMLIKIAMEE